MSTSVQQVIEHKLAEINPIYLQVLNESHMHSGPAEESHFNITAVSESFVDVRPVARHQILYQLLAAELSGPVHALALHLYTPEEWQKVQYPPASPDCRGGSKSGR